MEGNGNGTEKQGHNHERKEKGTIAIISPSLDFLRLFQGLLCQQDADEWPLTAAEENDMLGQLDQMVKQSLKASAVDMVKDMMIQEANKPEVMALLGTEAFQTHQSTKQKEFTFAAVRALMGDTSSASSTGMPASSPGMPPPEWIPKRRRTLEQTNNGPRLILGPRESEPMSEEKSDEEAVDGFSSLSTVDITPAVITVDESQQACSLNIYWIQPRNKQPIHH